MGRWGDGEIGKILIVFIIVMRYRKYSQVSYPDSRFPTPDSRLPILNSKF
ncbi:hypothetical protein BJP36_44025 [Moorena producens JHB]|uniref:Uncharacterized protein n=1 Tax=Moorena producens (strain JHB) TaxID=1454205 RepID=A0A9Q9STE5_MOOP1|nr:hypothetical protein [Moorena producens]WAN69329.1 hypothetical protein BJP36_44025 [Moorena producens JHB]